ncbi:response regulator [Tumidithrix elongata RA019]|uniref:Circadian input-output histidine kinase CikA n=1 Tax=Tumidithrix elongata BACA0141 TaxID=2716417 RepID=A0AAW9PX76_9CYAN|nr:response regulator [Tumidithrix elongata RA019]
MAPIKVLVVEDEVITGRVISEELSLLGYVVTDLATSDEEVIASVIGNRPDLVLMDIILKGSPRDGIEIATILRREFQLPFIYITAHTDDATLERAKNSEPYGYLVKPFDERDLRVAIETATYKHRMERQLAMREAQLSAILKSTSDAVIATDNTAEITYMNPAAEKLTGWRFAEALGRDVTEILYLVDENSGEEIAHPVPLVLQTGQVSFLNNSTATIDRQGIKKPVGDSASPICMPSGAIDGAVMVLWDMTDRKRAEAALSESESRFRNAFETAAIGMALNALDGRFLKVNLALCQLFGYSESELLSLTYQEITHADDMASDLDAMHSLLTGKIGSFNLEKRFWHKKRHIVWILLSVSLVRDTMQQPMYLIAQMQNISDRKQAEIALSQLNNELESRVARRTEALQKSESRLISTNEQLAIANAELARATRLKDEFLANMSHELRTPLNAVLGMAEGLLESVFGSINERQKKAIDTIERSGRHLLDLINDILDLAKIESGKLELQISDVPIQSICDNSMLLVRQMALKKNLRLSTHIPGDIGMIWVDDRRIRQVLINLLSNAIKFTPTEGSVTLEVWVETEERRGEKPTEEASSSQVAFSIVDSGIGISRENIQKLFQPFVQIDSSLSRQNVGTGLGLSLVQRIVTQHGGTVSVESEVGQGSRFTIRLPYGNPSGATVLPSTKGDPLSSNLILLVDDNEANVQSISSYLIAKGFRFISAKDGGEAIALARTENPNLILMEIQTPSIDGLEAIRLIRAESQLNNVPIIAMAALSTPSDRERCLAAGASDYLAKPFKLKQLVNFIQQLLAI